MNKFFSSLIILLSITFVGCTEANFQNVSSHGSSSNKINEPSYLQDETFLKYEKSCNNNEAQGCYYLFLFFMKAHYEQQSIQYGERACNMGHVIACFTMGLKFSEFGDVTKNLGKSKLYFEKGCDYQSPASCFFVGRTYIQEDFEEKDYNLAKKFFEKGCKLEVEYEQKDEYRLSFDKDFFKGVNEDACSKLAILYSKGWGTKQNLDQYAIYAEKSCNFGYARGCALVSAYYLEKRQDKKAQIYSDKACNLGLKVSCNLSQKIKELRYEACNLGLKECLQ